MNHNILYTVFNSLIILETIKLKDSYKCNISPSPLLNYGCLCIFEKFKIIYLYLDLFSYVHKNVKLHKRLQFIRYEFSKWKLKTILYFRYIAIRGRRRFGTGTDDRSLPSEDARNPSDHSVYLPY